MKVICILSIFVLQQYSSANFLGLDIGPDCITLFEFNRAVEILCDQKNNTDLWKKVIACHRPVTDEFLRTSGEAQCPVQKRVQVPTDTKYPIEEVFFNVCGIVQGSVLDQIKGGVCVVFGNKNVMSNRKRVAEVKRIWGDGVPCKIGECVKGLGLKLSP